MALNAPNRIFDGYTSLAGGMDGGRRPHLIDPDQAFDLQNGICRGGSFKTRPGFRHLETTLKSPTGFSYTGEGFATNLVITLASSGYIIGQGQWQGGSYYAPPNGEECIMASIGGRLWKIVPRRTTSDWYEIPIPDKRNRSNNNLSYMVQADRFHVTQDGESLPIIFDGISARRAAQYEVPVGTIMAYGMGRLVVVRPVSKEIIFGDLFGSHAGPDPGASVLQFTETGFLNEGGSATIPFSFGDIVGAVFYPQQDTASGQGELLIFAERGMASFFLSLPREQWKDSGNFQKLGLLDIGGTGHRAFVAVNGDIWFRSSDGWRTYRQARAEIQGWAQLPLSTPVRKYTEADTPQLLKYASAIHFDNRLISTCTPFPNRGTQYYDSFLLKLPKGNVFHNGLLSLDFDILSSFGQASKPSWDGHWSKLRTLQLIEGKFKGVNRAFAIGTHLDPTGDFEREIIGIYEITKNDVLDYDGPISSSMSTRAFSFQKSTPFNEKYMVAGDVWHDQTRYHTDVSVSYKPDQYPEWVPWKNYSIEPNGTAGAITIGGVPTIREGFFPRRDLLEPATACDSETTKRDLRKCYDVQVKLEITGNTDINRIRIHADDDPEYIDGTC